MIRAVLIVFAYLVTASAVAASADAASTLVPAAVTPDEDAFDTATKSEIQSVITKQLEAIGREDGKAAEEFAAPGIQDRFPDPNKFIAMVKENYAALIKPKSTQFGETAPSPHGPLQKMTVVAADGTVWEAIYSFQRVGGEWRITGCGLKKDENQQDI